jgi:hypothetical protein
LVGPRHSGTRFAAQCGAACLRPATELLRISMFFIGRRAPTTPRRRVRPTDPAERKRRARQALPPGSVRNPMRASVCGYTQLVCHMDARGDVAPTGFLKDVMPAGNIRDRASRKSGSRGGAGAVPHSTGECAMPVLCAFQWLRRRMPRHRVTDGSRHQPAGRQLCAGACRAGGNGCLKRRGEKKGRPRYAGPRS